MEKGWGKFILGLIFGVVIVILAFLIFNKPNQNSNQLNTTQNNSWLEEKIAEESNLENVWKCEYKNQIVYFFEHGCCDFLDLIYNLNGEKICALGGITGQGDGKCLDFMVQKTNCENLNNFPNCIKAGEIPFNMATGEEIGTCCVGLKQVIALPNPRSPEECDSMAVGYGPICTDCGNGVCEDWENRCRCVQDCPWLV